MFICYVQIGKAAIMSEDGETAVALRALSDAQLIQILQLDECNEAIARMIEAEIARRKQEGRQQ
jgi:hypothetical protein